MTFRMTRIALTGCIAIGAVALVTAQALDYPNRPIHLIVPYSAGGAMDVAARLVAKEAAERLGQPIVIENREGGAGTVGANYVAKSPANGYTFCWCQTGTMVITPLSDPGVPYKPLKDLIPVSHVIDLENVLMVRKDLPVKNFRELVEAGRKSGGQLSFGTPGAGGTHHLGGVWLARETGMNLLHVPYKGENPAGMAVMAGQVDLALISVLLAKPALAADRVRVLANLGATRSRLLPDIPTVAEQGFPNYSWVNFMGVNAPAGTPPEAVNKMSQAIDQALKVPEVQAKLTEMGLAGVGGTPAEYGAFLEQETAKWGKLVKAAGVARE